MVQINMHPQVVEEVRAGKPCIFSPHPKNITQELHMVGKWKKPLKIFFKEKDHGAKREAK